MAASQRLQFTTRPSVTTPAPDDDTHLSARGACAVHAKVAAGRLDFLGYVMNDLSRSFDTDAQAPSAQRLAGAGVQDREDAFAEVGANLDTGADMRDRLPSLSRLHRHRGPHVVSSVASSVISMARRHA
jgi:hypothetical protein